MTTETFVEKKTRNGVSWTLTTTVTREPATLSETRMARPRWFDYVGDSVTECYKVTVTTVDDIGGKFGSKDHLIPGSTWTQTCFEIVTPFGVGVVIDYQSGAELSGFIPKSGKAFITGCWKKYGVYRGHAISWFRAHRLSVANTRKVEHTCIAKLYRIAVGKEY